MRDAIKRQSDALSLRASGLGRPLYRFNGLGHQHHLGERSPRACLYRPASHGGLKVRRQHKSRNAVAWATIVDLSHEVQPAAVGQRDVDECSVQPTLPKPRTGLSRRASLNERDVELLGASAFLSMRVKTFLKLASSSTNRIRLSITHPSA